MRTYNEGDGAEFTASFFDAQGNPAAPSNIYWRLDCATSGVVLQDWTAADSVTSYDEFGAPLSVTATVEIAGSLNAIQKDRNKRETKELTVAAGLDTDRQKTESFQYWVVNRRFT